MAVVMETSTIRGIAFFGLLLIASFLLSPGSFLGLLAHRRQVWVVRQVNNRLWTRIRLLSTALFLGIWAWLVYSKSGALHENPRIQSRGNSHSPSDSFDIQVRVARVRERQ
jgi:hypothetical protein